MSVPTFCYLLRVPTLLPKCQSAALLPKCQKSVAALPPTRPPPPPWLPLSVAARATTEPADRTRAPLPELADVRSRRAKQSQRQQWRAAATLRLSANSGCSVFMLRVRRSYPSSSMLPHHRDSTSPGLIGFHRGVPPSQLDRMYVSGECGLQS